jgi:isoquinoline 1-oxidoreductase beta subunit
MVPRSRLDRREFLKTSTRTAGALILGFYFALRGQPQEQASGRSLRIFKPNAWLRITADNQITILVEKPELGQGSRTYTPMMIAEELEVDWTAIQVEQAPTIPAIYQGLRTGGSGGVASTFTPMRKVGAQAREMLVSAAAEQWQAKRRDCRAENGTVVHIPTNRRLSYGELVEAAANLPLMNPDEIALKPPKDFRYIGKPMPRTDVPSKVDGSAAFGIDVRVPGMLFAVIARCPFFGGKLQSFDATAAKTVPGVRAVFPVPALARHFNTAGGMAVVADSSWAAMQGRKKLVIRWEKGPDGNESTESLRKQIVQRAAAPATFVALDRGDALEVLAGAVKKLEASYESPFQAHATMEPMNTTVHVRDNEIESGRPRSLPMKSKTRSPSFRLSARQGDRAHDAPEDHSVAISVGLRCGRHGRSQGNEKASNSLGGRGKTTCNTIFYRPYNHQRLTGLIIRATCWHGLPALSLPPFPVPTFTRGLLNPETFKILPIAALGMVWRILRLTRYQTC